MSHDYKRNGATSLFAAFNFANGKSSAHASRTTAIRSGSVFSKLIERSSPEDKEIHIICDNYATHKHARVLAWLKRRKRFHVQFTPTSASWLNRVERFFRNLTIQGILQGVFRDMPELIEPIENYMASHNAKPTPFIWTASASDILEKVDRCRAKLNKNQSA